MSAEASPRWLRLGVLCEGLTEEFFVRDLLAPHLADFHIAAWGTQITTKRILGQPAFKGGGDAYKHIRQDVLLLLRSTDRVTTLLDYYGLPGDFPGRAARLAGTPHARLHALQTAFAADISSPKFIPYLVLHEFEALLFSDVAAIARELGEPKQLPALQQLAHQFPDPELINDSPETAPSKRLLKLFPGYRKPTGGTIIGKAIGLAGIRAKCQHFNSWLTQLELLGK